MTKFLRRNLYKKCDYRFTCSELAGEAVFGDQNVRERKAYFIPNAIDVDKFHFDQEVREQIRYELGLGDKFVIGHVGRFGAMKNHKYMLQILEQCIKIEKEKKLPETVMMFLGDGELKEEIREQAITRGISSRVLFIGNKRDVYRYYQAMDYFLLPSFYEGLPGTAIEAQASGLPGILSDSITKEAVVSDLLQLRSIQEKPILWAEEIMAVNGNHVLSDRREWQTEDIKDRDEFITKKRSSYADTVKKASFDVKEQAKKMQEFYLSGKF